MSGDSGHMLDPVKSCLSPSILALQNLVAVPAMLGSEKFWYACWCAANFNRKTCYFSRCVTAQNLVILGQTMQAYLGVPEN